MALRDDRHMEDPLSPGLLDKGDRLNPTRALILQAYYALRRTRLPIHIGARDISMWIKAREPEESLPSDALIRLTLMSAGLAHRAPGRPRHDGPAPVTCPPFCPLFGGLTAPLFVGRVARRSRAPRRAAGATLAKQMAAQPEPPTGGAPLLATHLALLVGRLMPFARLGCGRATRRRRADWYRSGVARMTRARSASVLVTLAQRGGTDSSWPARFEVSGGAGRGGVGREGCRLHGHVRSGLLDQEAALCWRRSAAVATASSARDLLRHDLRLAGRHRGLALAYHVSWHKPASPLQDALGSLVHGCAPMRGMAPSQNIRLHIWDSRRQRWAHLALGAPARRIPYLTVMKEATKVAAGTADLSAGAIRGRGSPGVRAARCRRVARQRQSHRAPRRKWSSTPRIPRRGARATKALRYRSAACPSPSTELPRRSIRSTRPAGPATRTPSRHSSPCSFAPATSTAASRRRPAAVRTGDRRASRRLRATSRRRAARRPEQRPNRGVRHPRGIGVPGGQRGDQPRGKGGDHRLPGAAGRLGFRPNIVRATSHRGVIYRILHGIHPLHRADRSRMRHVATGPHFSWAHASSSWAHAPDVGSSLRARFTGLAVLSGAASEQGYIP